MKKIFTLLTALMLVSLTSIADDVITLPVENYTPNGVKFSTEAINIDWDTQKIHAEITLDNTQNMQTLFAFGSHINNWGAGTKYEMYYKDGQLQYIYMIGSSQKKQNRPHNVSFWR